ncbi:DUF7007 domain-containing protein [Rhodococcus tibetensis]|uniref:DUF7007 domain-containing protein n=1 Tax=Rhodococcus tibetensis TaxID=2965064 RepID=A0ABT1QJX8_9NOCA|nr:hypothetical protein [Rhodococcus sp. FXJ9.536]MCQ4121360.1 hypothetical protein [Rhodococcus sp. FXJ9.536]
MNADNRIPASSPWGSVQYGSTLADGIITVSTAGHGGVRISPQRLRQMPSALRLGRRRWFEEDCESALVAVAFADDLELDDRRRELAAQSVADWFPTAWEAHFGRTLQPGQSYVRDKETFTVANADRMVADSATQHSRDQCSARAGVLRPQRRRRSGVRDHAERRCAAVPRPWPSVTVGR